MSPFVADDAPLILVVDDDPDVQALVGHRLRRGGYRTAQADDGLQALRAIGEEKPDLVLLDIGMPTLDGKAVARILQNAGSSGPSFIFLTAQASVSDRVEGVHLGAVDYITKPFSGQDLVARVEAALRRRGDTGATAEG
jgi:two-component system OmpR family response regulator